MIDKSIILIILPLIFIAGCATNSQTSVPQTAPAILTPERLTDAPTLTATVQAITPSPSPTPLLPTPSLEDSPIATNFLLANPPANCVLPSCWQGITVGKSAREEVQQLFDTTFGFEGRVDFFSESVITRTNEYYLTMYGYMPLPSGIYATSHAWYYPQFSATQGYLGISAQPSLDLFFWLDSKTNIVQSIGLLWGGDVGTMHSPTPVQVIQALGTPDAVYMRISFTREFYEAAGVSTYLFYRSGLIYYYSNAALFTEPDESGRVTVTACLDKAGNSGKVFLLRPMQEIDPTSTELTPLESQFLHDFERDSARPLKDVLGLTPEGLASKFEQGITCFHKAVSG